MDTASLELCKDLYQRSGWKGTDYFYQFIEYSDLSTGYYLINPVLETPLHANAYPAYDLGYLMRKLPDTSLLIKVAGAYAAHIQWTKKSTEEGDEIHSHTPTAYTPEDAACKLAIQLFEHGLLTEE